MNPAVEEYLNIQLATVFKFPLNWREHLVTLALLLFCFFFLARVSKQEVKCS